MTRNRNAAWYGLALLLGVSLVGACGGMEVADAQFEGGQAGLGFDHVNLGPDELVDLDGLAQEPTLMPRMPKAKRPWDPSLKRPAQRPPQPVTEQIDVPGRNPLVRCGDDELVDLMWDPNHCGDCFQACATAYCVEGVCSPDVYGR
jgi:hypothetical protein